MDIISRLFRFQSQSSNDDRAFTAIRDAQRRVGRYGESIVRIHLQPIFSHSDFAHTAQSMKNCAGDQFESLQGWCRRDRVIANDNLEVWISDRFRIRCASTLPTDLGQRDDLLEHLEASRALALVRGEADPRFR